MADEGGARGRPVVTDGGGWTLDAVRGLDAAALETLVERLLTAEGQSVDRAAPNSEGGVRLVATKSGLLRSTTTVVAVKPAGHSVSAATVDRVERARGINGADRGVVVRPIGFDDAVRAAAASTKVDLLAGERLVERLERAGVEPP